jgi:enoyl-CoA hydratase
MTQDNELLVRKDGRAGRLTMNRPKALNALTYDMVGQIDAALSAWQDDPTIELIVLDGAGDRGLCAGGDVRSLYDSRAEGSTFARRFWRDEYRLNARISRYPKPFVSLMDGIVMGGGIGLSAHSSHRIVTERSQLAMPETGIGLIPDVGGTWLLARAPGSVGEYLGLTGERMTASDAIFAGFADVLVSTARLPALVEQICKAGAGPVEEAIRAFANPPGPSVLHERRSAVDEIFSAPDVEAIVSRLDSSGHDWAVKTAATLRSKSPKALKITLAAVRNARGLSSLEQALDVEYRLVSRLFEDGEFVEGVRALLVDKDKAPKWTPPSLADVKSGLVAAYMSPLPAGEELGLGSAS